MYSVSRFIRDATWYATRPTSRNIAHWVSWAVTLGFQVTVTLLILDGRVYGWEVDMTRWMQDMPARNLLFDISNFLTNTLSPPFLVFFFVLVAGAALLRHRTVAVLLLLTFPPHVLAQFPKAIVDRDRPSELYDGLTGVGGPMSFPSGHAEFAVTFYGFLVFVLIRHIGSRPLQVAIAMAWLGLVLANGVGRIATGRHWPLDVFVAYAVGIGLLSGLVWLYSAALYARRQALQRAA